MHPTAQQFHDLYWHSILGGGRSGTACRRSRPLDCGIRTLWLVRPQLVIGSARAGGTATFLADMLDLHQADPSCRVITVDILTTNSYAASPTPGRGAVSSPIRPKHKRIHSWQLD
jgi:hypothetical protein